jgi:DoxX-like family
LLSVVLPASIGIRGAERLSKGSHPATASGYSRREQPERPSHKHSLTIFKGMHMFIAYVTVTLLAAVFTGGCAYTYLSGHDYPKAMMTMKRIPHSWGPMLGALLAGGALGLLAGFAVPLLGVLAAVGLELYFILALFAHLRVGSRKLSGWAVFFVTVTAALVVNLAYHGSW